MVSVGSRSHNGGIPGGRYGWVAAIGFSLLCGLLGEAVEVLRLQTGGVVPPHGGLRLSLFAAYAIAGSFVWGMARVLGRRRAAWASFGFGVLLLLPWLNFSYLPKFGSVQSLLGSAAAVAVVAMAAAVVVRFRAAAIAAVVLIGAAANLPRFGGPGPVRSERPIPGGDAVRPNVVVVLIDTLRADHLGAYGYPRPTSPHFDELARASVLFERAIAQAAWTKPSIASLMTGAFVHRHGVISSRDALGPDLPTLGEELARHGYHTAAFTSNPWITPEFRFDRGFDEFESGRAMGAQLTNLYRLLRRGDRLLKRTGFDSDLGGWVFWGSSGNVGNAERDRLLTDAVVEWLARPRAEPFFLYVHLIGPHDPYDPPAPYVQPFRAPEWDGVPARTVPPPRVQSIFETAQPLDAGDRDRLVAQYDGAIAYADAQLGRIVDGLRRHGLLDRTLLVVTADHGEEFYEHGNWRHGNQLYNQVVHIPLAFRLPNRLVPARRNDEAMLVDVFPTILGMLDLPPPAGTLDGRALFATQAPAGRAVFAEHWWFEGGTYVSRMVERGGLKLNQTNDGVRGRERTELYDLKNDSLEQRNLLENIEAVGENGLGDLQSLLAQFGEKVSVPAAVAVEVDESTKERLRHLGY